MMDDPFASTCTEDYEKIIKYLIPELHIILSKLCECDLTWEISMGLPYQMTLTNI